MAALAMAISMFGCATPGLQEFRAEDGLIVQVIQENRSPVPGATVFLYWQADSADVLECSHMDSAADVQITNPRGRAKFRPEEPGTFCIQVVLDGFVGVRIGPFEVDSFETYKHNVVSPIVVTLPSAIVLGP